MYFQFSPHYVHIFAIGDHAQITVSTIFSVYDKLEFINLVPRFVNFGLLYVWCALVKQAITQTINNFFVQIGHILSVRGITSICNDILATPVFIAHAVVILVRIFSLSTSIWQSQRKSKCRQIQFMGQSYMNLMYNSVNQANHLISAIDTTANILDSFCMIKIFCLQFSSVFCNPHNL